MADDPMRDIRLFQVCDLFLSQFNRQSAHGIFLEDQQVAYCDYS
jgi:hypothetical protein